MWPERQETGKPPGPIRSDDRRPPPNTSGAGDRPSDNNNAAKNGIWRTPYPAIFATEGGDADIGGPGFGADQGRATSSFPWRRSDAATKPEARISRMKPRA